MRLSLLLSCIVLVSASSAYNTCGNCQVSKNHPRLTSPELDILENKILESHIYLFQAVVVSFSHHLTTLASIELQKISLEWNLCRHMPIEQVVSIKVPAYHLFGQVSDCYYGVRNYWGALARQFWHGYYDPEVCFLYISCILHHSIHSF